jgi:hypothetical protein
MFEPTLLAYCVGGVPAIALKSIMKCALSKYPKSSAMFG